jgi:hypothetical protein
VVSAYDNTADRLEVRCYSVTGVDVKETGDYNIVQFEGSGDKYYASVYADDQVYQEKLPGKNREFCSRIIQVIFRLAAM